MEEGKVRIPDDDIIRYSFSAVKRSVNAVGNSRFDAAHDQQYGHADHWWSFCLAESSAAQSEMTCLGTISPGILQYQETDKEELFYKAMRGEPLTEREIDML
jgi:phage FluMu gp28-like protein